MKQIIAARLYDAVLASNSLTIANLCAICTALGTDVKTVLNAGKPLYITDIERLANQLGMSDAQIKAVFFA